MSERSWKQKGDKGSAIQRIQELLNRNGASPKLQATGFFGDLTDAAVRAFQAKRKLRADGHVDESTLAALENDSRVEVREIKKGKKIELHTWHDESTVIVRSGAAATTDPAVTLWPAIQIKHGDKRMADETAIHFPPGYDAAKPEVDVVVYFHGVNDGVPGRPLDKDLKAYFARLGVVEAFDRGKRNAILAVPKLGAWPSSGSGTLLSQEGGLRDWIHKVLSAVGSEKDSPHSGKTVTLRYLVLSGHSGGGEPVRKVFSLLNDKKVNDDLRKNLKATWMFDAFYGAPATWASLLAQNPAVQARFVWTNHSPQIENHKYLRTHMEGDVEQGRVVIVDEESKKPFTTALHNELPVKYMEKWTAQAAFLQSR